MKTQFLKLFTVFTCLFLMGCQSPTTKDGTVLLNKNLELPDGFSQGVKKTYQIQRGFNDTKARFSINVETLEKDSLNSVIKNVSVKLLKGSLGYEFSAEIAGNQINHGKREEMKTSCIATVGYFTKNLTGKRAVTKTFVIDSKGDIKDL